MHRIPRTSYGLLSDKEGRTENPARTFFSICLLLRSYFVDNQVLSRIHEQGLIAPAGKFLP